MAACGGLSSAARELGVLASSVTRTVDALEARHGVALLNRSTRRVTLSEAGRAYYDHTQRILEQLDAADDALTENAAGLAGVLRVAALMGPVCRARAPIVCARRKTVFDRAPRGDSLH